MTQPTPPFSWRAIAVPAYAPTLLGGIGTGAAVPIIAVSARELGASVEVAALLVAMLGVGQLIGDLPAGAFAARVGERWALVVATIGEALAMGVAALSHSLPPLFAAVLLLGLSGAVFGLARHAFLAGAVPITHRARALSTLGGVHRIGSFVGPLIGAVVIARWGTSAAYVVGVVAAALTLIVVLAVPDPEPVPDAAHPGPRARAVSSRRGIVSVLVEHRSVLATLGTGAMVIAAVRSVREAVVPLWAEQIGLDPAQISVVYGVAGAVDMLLFYPAGALMDRLGRAFVAVPSMLVIGLGLALVPLTASVVTLTLVAVLLGLGNGIGAGLVMTMGADVAPPGERAQFLGGWRLCADLGRAGGPLAVSGLSGIVSLGLSSVLLGGFALLGAIWLAVWVPRHDPRRTVLHAARK